MPCASSAAHNHVALPHCRRGRCAARSSTHALTLYTLTPALRPSRAQRIPSCAGVRARRLTPLVSSCVEPPQPFWPLPRPYCTTSHAMIVCTSWLHSALRTTRVVSSPFHGNTYRGTHIRAMSPGGLTAWPGDLALNPNPGPAQSTHVCQTRQVDARTPIRDVHPPRDDALCRQRLGAPIGRRGARSQSSPRRFCAPRPALRLWGGAR